MKTTLPPTKLDSSPPTSSSTRAGSPSIYSLLRSAHSHSRTAASTSIAPPPHLTQTTIATPSQTVARQTLTTHPHRSRAHSTAHNNLSDYFDNDAKQPNSLITIQRIISSKTPGSQTIDAQPPSIDKRYPFQQSGTSNTLPQSSRAPRNHRKDMKIDLSFSPKSATERRDVQSTSSARTTITTGPPQLHSTTVPIRNHDITLPMSTSNSTSTNNKNINNTNGLPNDYLCNRNKPSNKNNNNPLLRRLTPVVAAATTVTPPPTTLTPQSLTPLNQIFETPSIDKSPPRLSNNHLQGRNWLSFLQNQPAVIVATKKQQKPTISSKYNRSLSIDQSDATIDFLEAQKIPFTQNQFNPILQSIAPGSAMSNNRRTPKVNLAPYSRNSPMRAQSLTVSTKNSIDHNNARINSKPQYNQQVPAVNKSSRYSPLLGAATQIGEAGKLIVPSSARNSSSVESSRSNKVDLTQLYRSYQNKDNNGNNLGSMNFAKVQEGTTNNRYHSSLVGAGDQTLKKDGLPLARNVSSSIESVSKKSSSTSMQITSRTRKGMMPSNPHKVNQDVCIVLPSIRDKKWQHFFAVCDGHGTFGHDVSGYLRYVLPILFTQHSDRFENESPRGVINDIYEIANQKLACESGVDLLFSGSTVSSVYFHKNYLFCANIGDSRAAIGKRNAQDKWSVIPLSRDHKPNDPDEAQRILAENGRIEAYKDSEGKPLGPERVWLKNENIPGLAMTRSMGDTVAESVGVTWRPEIIEYEMTSNDKILVIASDGVWEFIDNKEIIKILAPYYQKNDIEGACDALMAEAHRKWTQNCNVIDDISFILVFMNI